MRWLLRVMLLAVAIYAAMSGFVAYAVTRPPEQFGRIMKHVPPALFFGLLPGKPMFIWAREGRLAQGDRAPDFTLPTHDRASTVTLSSFRGQRPVVLVFGSYT